MLKAVKYIVIDEIHIYRGVFGSHMANLVRRLVRIIRFYGGDPRFICCSATIGNPGALAARIVGMECEVVNENGAPSGEKNIVLYNPPLVDCIQGIRRGVVLESRRIALRFLKEKVKTIIFARSRLRAEIIASYLRSDLANYFNDNHRIRIESYRGGYLPNERREIERGLRDGTITGVVSTNALELGIDIGELDVSVLAGFPGSISSTWQQAGRAGRRSRSSLTVIVASMSPLDQYLAMNPDYFFGRNAETAHVDPDNAYILIDHIKCSLFELPFKEGENFGGDPSEVLAFLEEAGVGRLSAGSWYWSDRSYPAEQISLRTATPENVVIIDTTGGRDLVIGEMDRSSAKELLFDNAVYIHRGEQYLVTRLDIEQKKCFVVREEVNYYTDSIVKSTISLLQKDDDFRTAGCAVILGDVLVRRNIAKFKKIKFQTHENIGYGEIFLPEDEMHTRAALLYFPQGSAAKEAFEQVRPELREHLLGRIGNLIRNIAPVFLLCDRNDFGIAERLREPQTGSPGIYVYDSCPGGIGLAEGFAARLDEILCGVLAVVEKCPCRFGCPSCIGPDEGECEKYNLKETILVFLKRWVPA